MAESPFFAQYPLNVQGRAAVYGGLKIEPGPFGVIVSYGRGGGDFPSPAEPSNFHCPEHKQIYEGINRLYRIEGIENEYSSN
jgi:hypothetical protein